VTEKKSVMFPFPDFGNIQMPMMELKWAFKICD